ncbi:hypothetical protein GN956_G15440 [Arapaima gigas]
MLLWMCLMMWSCPGLNLIGEVLTQESASTNGNTIVHCFLGESVPLFTEQPEASLDWTLKKPDMSSTRRIYVVTQKGKNVERYEYINRTVILKSVKESDAGLHQVEFFNKNGMHVHAINIMLDVTCLRGVTVVSGYSGLSVIVFPENLTEAVGDSDVHWTKGDHVVGNLKRLAATYPEEYRGRAEISRSGRCTLLRAHRDDAGNYTLDIDTAQLRNRWVTQLMIKDPQLTIEQTCLEDGRAEFRCAVAPPWLFTLLWSLNGSLLGNRATGNSSNTQTLMLDQFPGLLFCTLEEYDGQNVSMSFAYGLGHLELYITIGASVTLLVLVFAVCFGFLRRRNQKIQMSTLDVVEKFVDTDKEFPPPPPPMVEEEQVPTTPVIEMSTFTY